VSADWTDERHAAARARCEAATPGPWIAMPDGGAYEGMVVAWAGGDDNGIDAICADPELDDRLYDRAFIAASRADLPAALDEIERLRAEQRLGTVHSGRQPDGTARLCHALYLREPAPRDYLGGSQANMLHDATDEIERLRARVAGMRLTLRECRAAWRAGLHDPELDQHIAALLGEEVSRG
jgi:hypothetical protein